MNSASSAHVGRCMEASNEAPNATPNAIANATPNEAPNAIANLVFPRQQHGWLSISMRSMRVRGGKAALIGVSLAYLTRLRYYAARGFWFSFVAEPHALRKGLRCAVSDCAQRYCEDER